MSINSKTNSTYEFPGFGLFIRTALEMVVKLHLRNMNLEQQPLNSFLKRK